MPDNKTESKIELGQPVFRGGFETACQSGAKLENAFVLFTVREVKGGSNRGCGYNLHFDAKVALSSVESGGVSLNATRVVSTADLESILSTLYPVHLDGEDSLGAREPLLSAPNPRQEHARRAVHKSVCESVYRCFFAAVLDANRSETKQVGATG